MTNDTAAVKNKHEREDWEVFYERERKLQVKPKRFGLFRSYDIFLFQTLVKKYIGEPLMAAGSHGHTRLKACEIGSGDGTLVREIAALLDCEAHGVDYSEIGSKIGEMRGVKTVIGDIFDEKILAQLRERFDVVFSYGFVEHIIPPEKAVDAHLAILKPGGYFFIQIPRFNTGFNYLRMKLFRPDLFRYHNLEIMEADALARACERPGVEKIFCGTYGTFKLRLPMEKRNFRYFLLKAICLSEYLFNPLLRILFGARGFETRFFSSAVIFIGRKK